MTDVANAAAAEIDIKAERLSRICHEAGVGGVILATQANFAWITGGRSNRIDGSRELGAGAILVAADGRRFVLANAIEMPRLRDEALAGIPCEPLEYPWTEEHVKPDTAAQLARRVLGCETVGADWALAGAKSLEREVARARAPLTAAEVDRYRTLGREAGEALGRVCRSLTPGLTEHEVARLTADAMAVLNARAIVTLVAADDRISRYRHPPPTDTRWKDLIMVVVCAQRDGLVVALSRIVAAHTAPSKSVELTRKTAMVFGRLLAATRPGASGRQLYEAAARAYDEQDFHGEERLHHQGGAIGYRSREWVAHPASQETVRAPQAFAWNPSITGTKVEETALATESGIEILTPSPGWPAIEIEVNGVRIAAPSILALGDDSSRPTAVVGS
jgi:Xaa-Pro aminopeptidase